MSQPKKSSIKKEKISHPKYKEKLVINGSFEDLMKDLIQPKKIISIPIKEVNPEQHKK